jgi:tetratricopeptide (TPR) repeat protein
MAPRTRSRLIFVAAASLIASSAAAQIPETFENLQVLPKNTPRDTLVQIMRGFTQSLGVRCEFCHVPRDEAASRPGGPGLNLIFASDDRENKVKARAMMRMTDSINTRFLASLPARDNPPTAVTCITCHRGVMKPTMIETLIVATTTSSGVDSAIARYRVLRNDMAQGRYNFGEAPVTEAARQLGAQGRHADAIKLMEMLQEFYPNSANIDLAIAGHQEAAGNRDAAIARYRAILAKNPNDRRAQQALQRLGVQP